jgi:hypothetical protein
MAECLTLRVAAQTGNRSPLNAFFACQPPLQNHTLTSPARLRIMPAKLLTQLNHAMIQRNTQSAINRRSRSAAGSRFAFRFSFNFSATQGAGGAMT